MFGRSFLLSGIAAFASLFRVPAPMPLAMMPAPIIGVGTRSSVPPFGSSKRTVAQDRRAATKRRAVKRARKLGHA